MLSNIGLVSLLDITYIVVCALIAIVAIAATIARIVLFFKYNKYNKKEVGNGLTGETATQLLLEAKGYNDVTVKRNGFFASWFFGNHYNVNKKRIGLRRGIYNKKSETAIGLACQKVGLVSLDKEGNKQVKARWNIMPIMLLAPVMLVPLVLIGLVLDLLIFKLNGVVTLVFIGVGLAFYILSFVYTLLTLKLEKQANQKALEIMEETNFLNAEQREDMKEIFKAYELAYVLEMIVALLEIIKYILQILMKFEKK